MIAIEPSTGDVLAFVSKPTYDPNLFVEGIDQQSWNELNTSEGIPLLNRALTGAYPPGSTYKPFMALAALELGKRTPAQSISDPGYFVFGNHVFNDDKVGGHGMVDMYRAIVNSCDTYFFQLANDLGVDAMHDFMKQFGLGQITGIDLENERRGLLPSSEWKRQAFKKPEQQRWVLGDTISLGIGQGQNTFTPLQMAHAVATLANNGVVMKPHLVKIIEDPHSKERVLTVPKESGRIPLKQENVDFIKNAMVGVTKEGTGRTAFLNAEYTAGGKTGTAQVIGIKKGEKYNASKLAEKFHDNAWYIAFAPAEQPRIAVAIIVENGGKGATAAAPIVRKAFDYYLLGKRPQEKVVPLPVQPDKEVDEVDDAITPETTATAPEGSKTPKPPDSPKPAIIAPALNAIKPNDPAENKAVNQAQNGNRAEKRN
jgi:penicillin-binding protein 2